MGYRIEPYQNVVDDLLAWLATGPKTKADVNAWAADRARDPAKLYTHLVSRTPIPEGMTILSWGGTLVVLHSLIDQGRVVASAPGDTIFYALPDRT